MKQIYTIIISILLAGSALAQDPQFTQFYAAPLYLNPAFAGAIPQNRLIFNSRLQWLGLPKAFTTYAASFDHNFDKVNSGVGFVAMIDRAGKGTLTSTTLGAIYAYKFRLTQRWIVRTAIQFNYVTRSLDFYKLTFGDQLDQSGTTGIVTAEQFNNSARVGYFDFNTGALIHNQNSWLGVSARHLNQPDQALSYGMKSTLPLYVSIHGGTKFYVKQGPFEKSYGFHRETSITPTFQYKRQGNFQQLDLGVYMLYEPIVVGFWYRGVPVIQSSYDAAAILLGLRWENLTFGYSYDVTISRLNATNTAGSHEVSLSVTMKKEKPKKRRRKDYVIPCPKF